MEAPRAPPVEKPVRDVPEQIAEQQREHELRPPRLRRDPRRPREPGLHRLAPCPEAHGERQQRRRRAEREPREPVRDERVKNQKTRSVRRSERRGTRRSISAKAQPNTTSAAKRRAIAATPDWTR